LTGDIGISHEQYGRGQPDDDNHPEQRQGCRQQPAWCRCGIGSGKRRRIGIIEGLGIVERCPLDEKWCALAEVGRTLSDRLPTRTGMCCRASAARAGIATLAMSRRSTRRLRIGWAFAHPRIVPPALPVPWQRDHSLPPIGTRNLRSTLKRTESRDITASCT
jgi:hypothetical protein